jgi:hypothetical protein
MKGGDTGIRRPPFYPAPVSQNEGNKRILTASYENLVRSIFISQLGRVTFAWFLPGANVRMLVLWDKGGSKVDVQT